MTVFQTLSLDVEAWDLAMRDYNVLVGHSFSDTGVTQEGVTQT